MKAINPATGEQIGTYEEDTSEEVNRKLEQAETAFENWRDRPIFERERKMADAGEVLRSNGDQYATLITREMGKPIRQSRSEIEKCAWVCSHYAEYASAYLSPEAHPSPPGTRAKTVYDPVGPVLAVMPWNFPFWQVFRFAAPYLAAGDVGVLKHASGVPGCARAIEEVFDEAGFPEGVFQSLLIGSDRVGDLLEDDRVRAATLTGSGPAGRSLARKAGENLKKTVLELGGSDPFLVLDDADVEQAAETGAWARNMNGGQSCIAAKRFLVHDDVYDSFLNQFIEEIEALTVGDPMDEQTDVGPQAEQPFVDHLHKQVQKSVEAGATLVMGGTPLDREGAYFPPTVLTDVPNNAPVAQEEIFGPVAAVFRVQNETEAIQKANRTSFGLGASIWTRNRKRGEALARNIEAGCVFINQLVKSDPRVPFGGIKDSGYGRELSEPGIKEFVNSKTVWVE